MGLEVPVEVRGGSGGMLMENPKVWLIIRVRNKVGCNMWLGLGSGVVLGVGWWLRFRLLVLDDGKLGWE